MKNVLGVLIALGAFIAMTDLAVVAATIPAMLGFRWQATLLCALPLLCVMGSLIVFWGAPVGNSSKSTLVRSTGRIPVFERYLVFVGIICGTVLLGMLSLNVLTSRSIQSLTLPCNTPMSITARIYEEVGEGVIFKWESEKRVYFLKQKRTAVQRALEREGITIEEDPIEERSN